MYKISFVENDNFQTVEFISAQRDTANECYRKYKRDPWKSEVEALTMTVTVTFDKAKKGKQYIYKCEDQLDPEIYKHVIVPDPDDSNDIKITYNVESGYKTAEEMNEIKKKGNFKEFKEIIQALMY